MKSVISLVISSGPCTQKYLLAISVGYCYAWFMCIRTSWVLLEEHTHQLSFPPPVRGRHNFLSKSDQSSSVKLAHFLRHFVALFEQ